MRATIIKDTLRTVPVEDPTDSYTIASRRLVVQHGRRSVAESDGPAVLLSAAPADQAWR